MDLKTVQTLLAEHSITKIKVGGFDIDGVLRGKYISRDKFDSAAETGLGFCDVIFGWDSSDALYDNVKVTGWHITQTIHRLGGGGLPDDEVKALAVYIRDYLPLPAERDASASLLVHQGGRIFRRADVG